MGGKPSSNEEEFDLVLESSLDIKNVRKLWKKWHKATHKQKKRFITKPEEVFDLVSDLGLEGDWHEANQSFEFVQYPLVRTKADRENHKALLKNLQYRQLVGAGMLKFFDVNRDNQVDFKELLMGAAALSKGEQHNMAELIFNIMDETRSGFLGENEIRKSIKNQLHSLAMQYSVRRWLRNFVELWGADKVHKIIDMIFDLWEKSDIPEKAEAIYFKVLDLEGTKKISQQAFIQFYCDNKRVNRLKRMFSKNLGQLIEQQRQHIDEKIQEFIQYNRPFG